MTPLLCEEGLFCKASLTRVRRSRHEHLPFTRHFVSLPERCLLLSGSLVHFEAHLLHPIFFCFLLHSTVCSWSGNLYGTIFLFLSSLFFPSSIVSSPGLEISEPTSSTLFQGQYCACCMSHLLCPPELQPPHHHHHHPSVTHCLFPCPICMEDSPI